jgi:hypothetical protein
VSLLSLSSCYVISCFLPLIYSSSFSSGVLSSPYSDCIYCLSFFLQIPPPAVMFPNLLYHWDHAFNSCLLYSSMSISWSTLSSSFYFPAPVHQATARIADFQNMKEGESFRQPSEPHTLVVSGALWKEASVRREVAPSGGSCAELTRKVLDSLWLTTRPDFRLPSPAPRHNFSRASVCRFHMPKWKFLSYSRDEKWSSSVTRWISSSAVQLAVLRT